MLNVCGPSLLYCLLVLVLSYTRLKWLYRSDKYAFIIMISILVLLLLRKTLC